MPRRKTTPAPASVWDAVPDVQVAEKQLKETEERLSSLPRTPTPEEARQEVIDVAVEAQRTDGAPIPADIGERAAEAYTAAIAPHAERLALATAVNALRRRMPLLKSRGSRSVLAALSAQLDDVLTEVREIVARSGHLDADSAIEAGEQGLTDYRRLRELVGVVDDIRTTQRSVYAATGDAGVLASLYRQGHDQFCGIPAQEGDDGSPYRRTPHPDALPADVLDVVQGRRRRDVPFLIYMAESGRAWLPVDLEELTGAARDAEDVGTPDDGANPFDLRETVTEELSAPLQSRI
ncbi:hypothetical protein ABZ177_12870 [Streptomyces sp. NPDC006284]|uniref:hypothetical protein n=1 Tax=Streptomyces sp. NPDC006284 TaxID=3156742 RepID=UPI0033B13BDB